jgi:hypothetical protein
MVLEDSDPFRLKCVPAEGIQVANIEWNIQGRSGARGQPNQFTVISRMTRDSEGPPYYGRTTI